MNIILTNDVDMPLYEQISSQIKKQIINGNIKPNEMLPSIRMLAKELKISVITTSRAYEELEKNGFIYTVKGKGCYVGDISSENIKEEYLKQIEKHLGKACDIAKIANIDKKELEKILELIYRGQI